MSTSKTSLFISISGTTQLKRNVGRAPAQIVKCRHGVLDNWNRLCIESMYLFNIPSLYHSFYPLDFFSHYTGFHRETLNTETFSYIIEF